MKFKKIRPLFNYVITTMDRFTKEDLDKLDFLDGKAEEGAVKMTQRVTAVGNTVRNIQVGDLVEINPSRYEVRKHDDGSLRNGVISDNITIGYNLRVIEIDDVPHMIITENDIDFVIEDFEE